MFICRLAFVTAALALAVAVVPVAPLHAQAEPDSSSPSTSAPTTSRPAAGTRTVRGTTGSPGGTVARGGRAGMVTGGVAGGYGSGPVPGGSGAIGGMTGSMDRGTGGRSLPPPILGEGPTCPFDATIYEVLLPVDQIGRIDLDALTRAATTAAAFEKALADLGAAKPLYRANQSVRLSRDSITVGTQVPYITNSQITNTGQAINSVSYTQVGAIFSISGKTSTPNAVELDLGIQVSTLSEGTTAISDTLKAPMFRNTTLSYKGPVAARQPFVVISADAASVAPAGKAVAYIARVTLGPAESGDTSAVAPPAPLKR
jgi:hypothetical protein